MKKLPVRAWIYLSGEGVALASTTDEAVAKRWEETRPGSVHEYMLRCPSRSGPLRCERPVQEGPGMKKGGHGASGEMHAAVCGTGIAGWEGVTAEWEDEAATRPRTRVPKTAADARKVLVRRRKVQDKMKLDKRKKMSQKARTR